MLKGKFQRLKEVAKLLSNIILSKYQKRELAKIIFSSLLLIIAFLTNTSKEVEFALYMISYIVVGFGVLQTALFNIKEGQVFDENFLMAIATIGALLLGEYAEAVFVMLFYRVGELFESIAVGRSRQSIQSLLEYAPEEARVIREIEELVDPDEVEVGEIILVYSGEKIPLDGIVLEGSSSLNMAFLTGESLPIDVEKNSEVHSGSINLSGVLKIQVTKEFEDSTVSKILELIENSSQKKSVLENFITRFARYYTPIVVIAALLLGVIPPLLFNGVWSVWVERALIFLVVSCPCALVISIPLTFFGGIGKASKNGILIKGSNFLEALSMVDTVVFDKTGTLTEGVFQISKETSFSNLNWKEIAGSLENYSNHPIAESIVKTYGNKLSKEITNIEEIHGMGLHGKLNGKIIGAGNEKLLKKFNIETEKIDSIGTLVYVFMEDKVLGVLEISDVIKEEIRNKGLSILKDSGIKNLVLLTGDKKEVGEYVGKKLQIDTVYSELLPEDKVTIFEKILASKSKNEMVAFVGDGINDAPVLTRSDVGIAMGALGSDAAIEAADIVLMDDKISKIALAKTISKNTVKIAKQNIVLALGVKFLVLGLSVFGLASMWMAIFADVGVMVLAVINSMRTLR